jgi:hypothetical protein
MLLQAYQDKIAIKYAKHKDALKLAEQYVPKCDVAQQTTKTLLLYGASIMMMYRQKVKNVTVATDKCHSVLKEMETFCNLEQKKTSVLIKLLYFLSK